MGCAILSSAFVFAQTADNKNENNLQSQSQLMEERVSELMADLVPVKKTSLSRSLSRATKKYSYYKENH